MIRSCRLYRLVIRWNEQRLNVIALTGIKCRKSIFALNNNTLNKGNNSIDCYFMPSIVVTGY